MKNSTKNSVLIIDNYLELKEIEEKFPDLINAPLILLSGNFTLQQLASFKERKYEFFDRSITPKSAKKIGSDIYYFIWNWFLDDSGKDISKIDGCSLGLAFVPSLEILLNTVLRYHTGLSNILNAHNHIYFSSQVESVFIEVIKDLHQSIGFECSIVESKIKSIANKSGKNQQVYDASYRKRDLSPLFNPESLKFRLLHKIIYYLTNIFQSVSTKHPRVVIMSAGKDEDYLEHIKSNYPKAFRWVVPVTWKTKVLSLVSVKKKELAYYFFTSCIDFKKDKEVRALIKSLDRNIKNKLFCINSALISRVMKAQTYGYFNGAINYYCSARKNLIKFNPSIFISPTEFNENYILASQAAKNLGIKTVLASHGLEHCAQKGFRPGKFKIFDYALAMGSLDVSKHMATGFENKHIVNSTLPYFERFLPVKKHQEEMVYKKALVLLPDFFNFSPAEKIGYEYVFVNKVVKLLKELNIAVVGIKSKEKIFFENIGLYEKSITICGSEIPIIYGGNNFPQFAKESDFIIGPTGSSIVEAGLMGKDYYTFAHAPHHKFAVSILPVLHDIVNISYNMIDLKENILQRKTYRDGYSVLDLVNLDGIRSKQDLYLKYENSIESILEEIG